LVKNPPPPTPKIYCALYTIIKKIDIHLLTFGPKLKTFKALAIKSHSRLSKAFSKSL